VGALGCDAEDMDEAQEEYEEVEERVDDSKVVTAPPEPFKTRW